MQVVIRTDASSLIGTGHVMRCMALAERLSETGATCLFVCANLEGHVADMVKSRGHGCVLLQCDAESPKIVGYGDAPPSHAGWLRSSWQMDAEESIEIIEQIKPVDYLIVDHYALDDRWEKRLKPHVGRLIVVDDLADRPHCADILVDQNYGRQQQHYANLVPDCCKVLTGAQFALLRPQFADNRQQALSRRRKVGGNKLVLVFLGGGSTDLALENLANVICRAQPQNLSALILVTGQARNGEFIAETLRKQLNVPVEVKHNVENMARLMSRADLAIGGGGISSWERCTLGLPSLVVLLADNQKEVNHQLAKERCIFASVDPHELEEDLIGSFIDMDDSTYRKISCNAASVCDGFGTNRVIEALGG